MRKNPKKIGKAIAQLKAKMSKATPEERTKLSNEISRLKALKLPGSVINIEDKIMLNYHPNKKGKIHSYIVDEFNGKKIAVLRISHSVGPETRIPLTSMRKDKKDRESMAQLNVIYFGKSGKPIHIHEARELGKREPKPTRDEISYARKKAIRDEKLRSKWKK